MRDKRAQVYVRGAFHNIKRRRPTINESGLRDYNNAKLQNDIQNTNKRVISAHCARTTNRAIIDENKRANVPPSRRYDEIFSADRHTNADEHGAWSWIPLTEDRPVITTRDTVPHHRIL